MPLSIQVKKQTQQGPSGFSGSSGFSGQSGSGTSGASTSGYSGQSGAQGNSGWSGLSGVGFSGPAGSSGVSGYSGKSGIGFSGPAGVSGWSGTSGQKGNDGLSGASGISTSGYSGVSGAIGIGISGYSGQSGIGFSGPAGVSGYSGTSGQQGSAGSGISGWSGFSGPSASVYDWTEKAFVTLDETRIATWDPDVPPFYPIPTAPMPPASAELNLALDANTQYFLRGLFWWNCPLFGQAHLNTGWGYTGMANAFKCSYVTNGNGYDSTYSWQYLNAGMYGYMDIFYTLANDPSINVMVITGSIQTSTSGVLSFCWEPAKFFGVAQTGILKAQSYIFAEKIGGAASGCSGFSGKTGVVMVGSWLGI